MITTGSIYPLHEYLLLTVLNRGRQLLPGDQQLMYQQTLNTIPAKL